jgi:pyrroline-5-carboxylate reductase
VLVSVAAGITLESIGGWFGSASPAIRVMPNQPALIGQGMSGLCANGAVDATAKAGADYLVAATGRAVWLDNEELMDAVTAVSGSGPAYFYLFMEIMADIGTELGLSEATARTLVTQTALGTAAVANQRPETLAELRRQVTSPGGTTEAAISMLEREGIRDILRKALTAAHNRSIELGKPDLS